MTELNSPPDSPYTYFGLTEFLEMYIPPRDVIVDPWLTKQSLAMIYAKRGIGKTFFALHLALGIASGNNVFNWSIDTPYTVLYVDGEMCASLMQQRLNQLIAGHKIENNPQLSILTPDFFHSKPLNLNKAESRQDFLLAAKPFKVIILDNISCLFGGLDENDSATWNPIQEWLLALRADNKTVILIHHAGKSGNQRGTSKHEDILDVVLKLEAVQDSHQSNGAIFKVSYEKARGIVGNDLEPFIAHLNAESNKWELKSVEGFEYKEVIELFNQGLKQKEIAKKLNVSDATVSRIVKSLKEKALI